MITKLQANQNSYIFKSIMQDPDLIFKITLQKMVKQSYKKSQQLQLIKYNQFE